MRRKAVSEIWPIKNSENNGGTWQPIRQCQLTRGLTALAQLDVSPVTPGGARKGACRGV